MSYNSPQDNDSNRSPLEEQIRTQITDINTWLRLFYMALFMVVFYIVYAITCVVGIIQFFAGIFTGKTLASLSEFNAKLSDYARDVVAYITYASSKKPFPFKE
jgi:hypothetical protein